VRADNWLGERPASACWRSRRDRRVAETRSSAASSEASGGDAAFRPRGAPVVVALVRGAWVVCDRFADSTRAYQGAAGGTPAELIAALETHILEDTRPDLTLIFDLPVAEGLERAHARAGAEMRFESKGQAFHERLREGFLAIARGEPGRCVVIDATGSLDEVEARVWAAVDERLAVHG